MDKGKEFKMGNVNDDQRYEKALQLQGSIQENCVNIQFHPNQNC